MTFHDSASGREQPAAAGVEPFSQVAVDLAEQRRDAGLLVVAGDVGVEVEPDALDAVLVRAVGRQEVQPQLIAELDPPRLGQAALVDDAVVEDHVDRLGLGVGLEQRPQQVEEQPARLALALDLDQPVV